ncbi:Outer membrane protein beta-barrel domain-containing protein [Ferrimonas marina]|uniref:Outer membrane protein beta-barrel domain-containing protein n=2 Tax=Ferrimonas marina TaxID=299255 RepID=A0A1M5VHM5_9GAMM|nr:Outer membrane protein beta-barrel domain-containing protein [Ferrimonas marina]
MTTRKLSLLCAALTALILSPLAQAKDEGLYLGVSLGAATINQEGSDPDLGDFEIDSSDFAWKVFAGYQFNGVLAVEGGYRELGSAENSLVKTDPYGIDVFVIGGIPLGPLRGFGKIGGIYWDNDTDFADTSISDDGFDLAAGLGLEFELGSFAIRGEVEYLDVLDETWMYTLGATFTF